MGDTKIDRLMTATQLAEVLAVDVSTVRRWSYTWKPGVPVESRRGVRPVHLGGALRFLERDVQAYIENLSAGANF